MNYAAIYEKFIGDRRAKEAALISGRGYTEAHHILPKSLGGCDDPLNLIVLTPEDHFFAHLLLAKIHGGGMWVAVRRMRWGRIGGARPWVAGRYMYGVAKRRQAEWSSARQRGQPGKRGSDNGMHDATVLEWTNLDTGETLSATKWDMWTRFGGSRGSWTQAETGVRKSIRGWTPRPSEVRIRGLKGKKLRFVNRDGRTFEGTQGAFCKMTGLSVATGSRVAKDQSVTACGWRHENTWDRAHNCRKSDGLPTRARRLAA